MSTQASKRNNMVLLLAVLLDFGPIVSNSGRARAKLLDLMTLNGSTWESAAALNLAFKELGNGIKRDVRGRRTYSIEVTAVPDEYMPDVELRLGHLLKEAPPQAEVEPEPTSDPEPELPPSGSTDEDIERVARSILDKIFEIHDAPRRFEFKQQQLHEAREQREAALRRADDIEGDLVTARKTSERHVTRIRNLEAEISTLRANLDATLRSTRFAIDGEVRKEIEKLMKPSQSSKI